MSSVVVVQKYDHSDAAGFSLWMNKMKVVESQVHATGAGNKKVMKLDHQGESKKKKLMCLCSPTDHPGSFRCRYHRSKSVQTSVKTVEDPAAVVARRFLKLNNLTAKPMAAGGNNSCPGLARLLPLHQMTATHVV